MEFQKEQNRIFSIDETGKLIAEVTFPEESEGIVNIDHTFVDDSLRGQGAAAKIMAETAQEIQESGRKATLTCSYAKSWFAKHMEYKHLLK